MKAHRRVAAALLLAGVAVTGGCGSPSAGQEQAEPDTGLENFGYVVGSAPAWATPAPAPVPDPASSFMGVDEIPAAVLAARDRFPEELPDGIVWSIEDFTTDPLPRDAVFEEGVYDVAAAEYWLCAWMGEYIKAEDAGDRQRTAAAVSELEKYPALPAIAAHHASPEAVADSVIRPAKLGDSAKLRKFFESCTSYRRANPA